MSEVRADPAPAPAAAAVVGDPSQHYDEADPRERALVFALVNASHLANHVASIIGSVLYPVMATEMGFGFFQIGLLSTVADLAAQGFQVVYGFLVRWFPRSVLLGVGNIIVGISSFATGISQNFGQALAARVVGGVGNSAQHPVGSAILVNYFPRIRGRMLTIHTTFGNLGGLAAPVIAGGLLLFTDWRMVFFVVAVPSVIMGIAYFFLRDHVSGLGENKKARTKATLEDYKTCLRNRNVMLVSLIQMVGAAGRGTGINAAFLTGFFLIALGVDISTAAGLMIIYQVGGFVGPLVIGWLSDLWDRKWVVQLTLLLSTVTTLWLLVQHGITPWLIINLILYGSVVNARSTLTQAMVSDAIPLHLTDAAFSLYFFIGFISGPLWTFIMGWIIDSQGFTVAFVVVSVSYVIGMVLILFAKPDDNAVHPGGAAVARGGA
jgi:MFS family permease